MLYNTVQTSQTPTTNTSTATPILSNAADTLYNTIATKQSNSATNVTTPILSNMANMLYNTILSAKQSNSDSNITTPTLMNASNALTNTTITTTQQTTTPTPSVTVIEHKVWREGNTVYSKIVYSDGTEDLKTLDLTDYYNEAYNEGVNSVDFSKTNHTIENGIIKVTTTLTNGKSQEYAITLDENLIVSLYNQIMANRSSCFQIRQNETEYSFLVESRQYQPQPNLAYQPAVDGTPVYEILGKEQKTWNFTLYVDTIPKMQFLQQLASNPVCEVYFDEIDDWKQALITSISLTRITTGHYYADIELVIL
ncbi:hypothetical protein Mefer_1558 [Methanocaldococcus fervens AG86]|uniref:Uncharacterized protein n=1 Tax=Methanocaldococcus fervens (strain DSM 4213 / JCM 15782 / AG86) TaxID=573064 RepID=C7P5I3_METFA|nr:hypothetical protein Mefer_1558 [Methanocaldococcus fervens AG86]